MALNDGRVVSNFIIQALKGEDITVYGDGEQTRSFQHVDDLVDGVMKMMEKDKFIGPVNMGNPNEFTMLKLAEEVLSITKSKSKIAFKPLPADDPTQRKPSIKLAKKILGWEPGIQLKEGLNKTIEYFKERLKINEI
jgi:UDP-glucuronate decarboxylase